MKTFTLSLIAASLVSTSAMALDFDFDQSKAYVGAGMSMNSASGSNSSMGFQVFAGYELDFELTDKLKTMVEAGYMTVDLEYDVPSYSSGGGSSSSIQNFDDLVRYYDNLSNGQFSKSAEASLGANWRSILKSQFDNSGALDQNVVGSYSQGSVSATVSGFWISGVVSYPVSEFTNAEWAKKVDLLGRVGLDFGDDDGLLYGVGAEYSLSEQWAVRGEYVLRSNINSLQANVVYKF